MSLGRYLAGVILSAVAIVPLGIGGSQLRARFLPSWRGAPARLADALLALALLFGVLQVVGAVGAFRLGPVVAACVVVGAAATVVGLRRAPAPAPPPEAPHSPHRILVVAAVAVTALLVAQWTAFTFTSFRNSIDDSDSMQYHLPIAARFVQLGRVTEFVLTSPEEPRWAHPANSELLHGTGMLLFSRDIVSPLMNLGWLALILLAAWCIGRPRGLGPLTVIGAACLLAQPVFVASQAGTAFTDLPAIALLLASVAVMMQSDRTRAAVAVAGAAAGMSVAMKLTTLLPVLFLTGGVLILAVRSKRLSMMVDWMVPLFVTGSFWFLRNLVRAGNPLPGADLKIGPVGFAKGRFAILERELPSVSDYFGDPTVWRRWIRPALPDAFGPLWFGLFALVLIGLLFAIVKGPTLLQRVLGAVGLASAIAYLFTPATAGGPAGQPIHFAGNLRFLAPTLFLGATLLALAGPLRGSRAAGFVAVAFIAVMLAAQTSDSIPAWPPRGRRAGPVAGVVVLAAGLLWANRGRLAAVDDRRRRTTRPAFVVALVLAATGATVGGYAIADRYMQDRYKARRVWAWARTLDHQRIAISGFLAQYPLYGPDLSNRVQYIGVAGPHGEFHPTSDCAEWQGALRSGRYNYVVLEPGLTFGRVLPSGDPPELLWTSSMPGATSLFVAGRAHVFRLDPSAPSGGCDGTSRAA